MITSRRPKHLLLVVSACALSLALPAASPAADPTQSLAIPAASPAADPPQSRALKPIGRDIRRADLPDGGTSS
jgi:hypothetical protein